MSTKSTIWLLAACTVALILGGSTGVARAQNDFGPLGVDFSVSPAAAGGAFPCLVAIRSLTTGEGILVEKFSAAAGKDTTFKKSGKGLDVDVDLTIAPGGASVLWHVTVSTTGTNRPLGIYGAQVKLHG